MLGYWRQAWIPGVPSAQLALYMHKDFAYWPNCNGSVLFEVGGGGSVVLNFSAVHGSSSAANVI